MTRRRTIEASPTDVWAVLADGWLYPVFVVGAARMRAVDDAWPAVGARLHHSAGAWPVMLDDTTRVTVCEPGRRLELTARGWPAGQARVVIELASRGPGRTEVSILEDATSGAALAVPGPLRRRLLDLRNGETLQRLGHLARGRAMARGRVQGDDAL